MIVLLETIHDDAVARLKATGHDVVYVGDSAEFDRSLPADEVVAIVTRGRGRVDAQLLGSLPNLRAVGRCGVGLDNIDTDTAAELGVAVAFAPGTLSDAVAETALMLQLAAARDLVRLATATEAGDWAVRDDFEGVEMRGKRLGVVGVGSIGARIAALGRAFGMDVVGWSRSGRTEPARPVGLDELFSTSHVVQLCVALTDETRGLVGESLLARLPPGAILVNTARGGVIDPVAVVAALDGGNLRAYATDVWTPEPPDPDDPLLVHPRSIVSPHAAAMTDVTYRKICVRAADAVACLIEGREPEPSSLFAKV